MGPVAGAFLKAEPGRRPEPPPRTAEKDVPVAYELVGDGLVGRPVVPIGGEVV